LIVGYQARGTLGRILVDGAEKVRVAGEEIAVNATIHTLGGFSAHAGQSQLLDWVAGFHKPLPEIYLVHGEEDSKKALQKNLLDKNYKAEIPGMGQKVEF
jgi:metallo-beta-lactamase family protein